MADYYTAATDPADNSDLTSSVIRSEWTSLAAGFAKVASYTGNASKAVIINAGATAQTVTTGTLALAGNFATSGSSALTLTTTGATNVTLPTTGTLATLAGTEELDNKTLDSSVGKGTWTASGTWTLPAVTLGGTVSGGGNQINNVIIGTITPLAITGTTGVFTSTLDVTGVLTATGGIVLPGTAANLTLGANYISYGGTDAGFSLDSSNNATLTGTLAVSGTGNSSIAGPLVISGASAGQIVFPATQNASSDVNTLDDYEEYTAASAACTGAITTAAVWKLTKVGNKVTLTLPQVQGAGVAVASFVFGTAIPAAFRPAADITWPSAPIYDNAAALVAPGAIFVASATGNISVYIRPDFQGAFTVTAQAGLTYATSVSWTI